MKNTVIQFPGNGYHIPRGTILNDTFEIEEQIGAGGMGEIYRGRVIETGTLVAIKTIKPDLAGNESMLALFRKEAVALNTLQHESIVKYYVFAFDPKINRRFLAMEYVDGQPLSDFIRNRPLKLDEVHDLRRRLASGLQAAHDKEIVHRDLSPDNIILPNDDIRRAKIIDFGIARSTKLGATTIIGQGFAGKYSYVSPEQIGLFGGEVTNRSDIYSLGLVLAEAILGKALDMGGTQLDVVDKRRVVPDLSSVDPQIRPLLAHMLQPKPEDRPESMRAVEIWTLADSSTSLVAKPGATKARSGIPRSILALGFALAVGGGVSVGLVYRFGHFGGVNSGDTNTHIDSSERIGRIAEYVRYYDGDPCLYLSPVTLDDHAATIAAFADNDRAIKSFVDDFKATNGFEAKVTSDHIDTKQCDVVRFLQRLDPTPDIGFQLQAPHDAFRLGDNILLRLTGAKTRYVSLLAIDESGRVSDLTAGLVRHQSDYTLEFNFDDQIAQRPAELLLLALTSETPIKSLSTVNDAADMYAKLIKDNDLTALNVGTAVRVIKFE